MTRPVQIPSTDFAVLFKRFDEPVTPIDCGRLCSIHNPRGVPFCCDICQAVPVLYHREWEYLQSITDLWQPWQGSECQDDPTDPADLRNQVPDHMLLAACRGAAHCEREFRSLSCRQFPFFPYISADDRILGLAYHWDFEDTCWVISNLEQVSESFRRAFIDLYDDLLAAWDEDFESYAALSQDMREEYSRRGRRIPLLHRNGSNYLISPRSGRMRRVDSSHLPKFGPYHST